MRILLLGSIIFFWSSVFAQPTNFSISQNISDVEWAIENNNAKKACFHIGSVSTILYAVFSDLLKPEAFGEADKKIIKSKGFSDLHIGIVPLTIYCDPIRQTSSRKIDDLKKLFNDFKVKFEKVNLSVADKGRSLDFYLIDVSNFYGNGKVVWFNREGLVIVQILENSKSTTHQTTLARTNLEKVKVKLTGLESSQIKVNDRTSIPDEVRIRFGVRDINGHLVHREIWDQDWDRQNDAIKNLSLVAKTLVNLAKEVKPVNEQKYQPGKITINKPSEFDQRDMDDVIK